MFKVKVVNSAFSSYNENILIDVLIARETKHDLCYFLLMRGDWRYFGSGVQGLR